MGKLKSILTTDAGNLGMECFFRRRIISGKYTINIVRVGDISRDRVTPATIRGEIDPLLPSKGVFPRAFPANPQTRYLDFHKVGMQILRMHSWPNLGRKIATHRR